MRLLWSPDRKCCRYDLYGPLFCDLIEKLCFQMLPTDSELIFGFIKLVPRTYSLIIIPWIRILAGIE